MAKSTMNPKVDFYFNKAKKLGEEFEKELKKSAALKKAFYTLTPGRQRGYLLHFSQAKLAKTREARVAKAVPRILKGKGLDD